MLKIRDLIAGYGPIRILKGVTLEVRRGSIVTVLGGNGAGKSTLLKVISGLVKPTSGSIEFAGAAIQGLRPDKIVRLGLVQVTQGKEAFPGMTIEENLRIGAFTQRSTVLVNRGFEQVYSYFPVLAERRRTLAATLSGGQLQMLCIGRGLMANPKMLLLDEPSAAVAPLVVLEIFCAIARISRNEGLTVLLVEQNVRMALLLAEYGYVIQDGAVSVADDTRKLIQDDRVRLSYLGSTVMAEG